MSPVPSRGWINFIRHECVTTANDSPEIDVDDAVPLLDGHRLAETAGASDRARPVRPCLAHLAGADDHAGAASSRIDAARFRTEAIKSDITHGAP